MITKKDLIETRDLLFQCMHFYIDCNKSNFTVASTEFSSIANGVWSDLTSIIQVLSILTTLIEKHNEDD